MKLIKITIDIKKAPKPDDHKFDIYIVRHHIDSFGKDYIQRKIWDTCLNSDIENSIKQAENVHLITRERR